MNIEEQFVAAFIRPEKRQRYRELLANPRRRRAFLRGLAHTNDLSPEHWVELPAGVHTPAEIERLLRQLGAGPTCTAISESAELDGNEHELRTVLETIVGNGRGTCLSCVPGRLGYYEGEGMNERAILLKTDKK